MKNQNKIIDEIEAVGLRVKVISSGFAVYTSEEDEYIIFKVELDKLIAIAHKYGLNYYVNFEDGVVRLH